MLKHFSVLKDELLEGLQWQGGVLIDCTLGFGGHTLAFLESSPLTQVYAFDRDNSAITLAKERLQPYASRIHFHHCAFSAALEHLDKRILKQSRGIIADLGVSSMQLDDKHRGFNFNSKNLDMRMDTRAELSAQKVLNSYPPTRLEEIFRIYGEFKQSKKLTHIIVESREKKPFESCAELSALIEGHFPRTGGIHPATLAFQALRIEVNDELNELRTLLSSIEQAYRAKILKNCKIGIIAFHSLEDRIIKQYFKQWSKSCICPQENYKCECGNNNALGEILTKKPITPKSQEISQNKRSRSAKLRIFALGTGNE